MSSFALICIRDLPRRAVSFIEVPYTIVVKLAQTANDYIDKQKGDYEVENSTAPHKLVFPEVFTACRIALTSACRTGSFSVTAVS